MDCDKPKKRKVRSKGQGYRVTLDLEPELLEKVEALAEVKELSLRDYIRQFLKHKVVANKTGEGESEPSRGNRKQAPPPTLRGLPTNTGRLIASPHDIALPDPFLYPDTEMARALIKRAVRHQALPQAWGYGCLLLFDREGMPYHMLNQPDFPHITHQDILRTTPFWKSVPGELGDRVMSHIRRALQGDHSQAHCSTERQGRQVNFMSTYFDLGKGLAACVVKHSWEQELLSVPPPTDYEELSRHYLAKKKLEFSDPQFVWWVQETGSITDHRSQLEVTGLFHFSKGRLRHMEEMFDADSATCIMNYLHAVFQTQTQRSFTVEETWGNVRTLNSYRMYPLNTMWPNEGKVVMVIMSCLASKILDLQKMYSAG